MNTQNVTPPNPSPAPAPTPMPSQGRPTTPEPFKPGFLAVRGPQFSPEAALPIIQNRKLPPNIYDPKAPRLEGSVKSIAGGFASNTAGGAYSITEMARALYNVDLIFEFVKNNIEWIATYGLQKGGLGALADGYGNAFDQCDLMIQLLRANGYTANYIFGQIRLYPSDFTDWFGTDTNGWSAGNMLSNGGIPNTVTWDGTQYYVDMDHVWVKCTISGTDYVFDPARKSYTVKTGINLATATGYNATTFLNNAKSGATVTTDYVQKMNRGNVRSDLNTYATSLVSYIKSNTIGSAPAGTATIDDVLGGRTINQITSSPVRNTSLSYQTPGSTPTTWTSIPNTYKATLQVQYDWNGTGYNIDQSFYSADIHGKRLTLFFNASHQAQLRLDGTVLATSSAQGVGTWNSVLLTAVHPYPSTFADSSVWQTVFADQYYIIANAWGNAGRFMASYHQQNLTINKLAGGADSDENVLGESLEVLWHTWNSEKSIACDLFPRMTGCTTVLHHQVGLVYHNQSPGTDLGGIVWASSALDNDYDRVKWNDNALAMHGIAFEAGAIRQIAGINAVSTTPVVEAAMRTVRATIGGTVTNGNTATITVIDAGLAGGQKSVTYNITGSDTLTTIATGLKNAINGDTAIAAVGVSASSSGAVVTLITKSVNTTTYSSSTSVGATVTITLVYDKVYKTDSSNWSTGTNVKSILSGNGYSGTDLTNIENWYINWGWSVGIPDKPVQTIDSFTGLGYYALSSSQGMVGIISGSLKGAFGSVTQTNGGLVVGGTNNSYVPYKGPTGGIYTSNPGGSGGALNGGGGVVVGGPYKSNEPIDLCTGAYLYNRTDMSLGSQGFPFGLSFGRTYNSQCRLSDGPLGRGWAHNFQLTAKANSDGIIGMASSPICSAAALTEMFICVDLFKDLTKPVEKVVTASLACSWMIDQVTNNTVAVNLVSDNLLFVKLPDGSYANAQGSAVALAQVSGLYVLTTPQGIKYNFDSTGAIATIVHPAGTTVTFTYSSGKLQTVSNGLGRTLTLTYSGNDIASVSDGNGRSVSYTIDASRNLTTFTDANSKATTYSYDLPGRMTQIFKPANPSSAIVTNTYDSLERVKTQKDAFNHQWDYFFAGSRTEERDPNGNSSVHYFNGQGKRLKFINQVGQQWTAVFDGLGRQIQSTAPEGNSVSFVYDSMNNVQTVTAVAKSGSGLSNIVQNFTYDSTWNKVLTAQDGRGNTTTFSYNATTGTLKDVQRPAVGGLVPKAMFFYNSRGQVLSVIDETGIQSQLTYDGSTEKLTSSIGNTNWTATIGGTVTTGNVLTLTANDASLPGGTKSVSYTVVGGDTLTSIATGLKNAINGDTTLASKGIVAYSSGAVVSMSTAAGNTTTFSQSVSGGATETITLAAGLNLTASFGYDSVGNTTSVTDPRSNQTTFTFDSERRLTQRTECSPFSYLTQFGYDDSNNLTSVKRQMAGYPAWQTVTMTYSLSDKKKTVTDPTNKVMQWDYDTLDRAYRVTDPELRTVTSAFDAAGRLYTVTDNSGSVAQTYSYTNNGQVYQFTDARSKVTTYSYDGHDRPDRTTYPDSTYEQNSSYDANGNVWTFRFRSGNTIANTFDVLNRLATKSPTSQPVVTMSYDLASRVTKVSTPVVSGHPESGDFQYFFDSAGRLIKEQAPDGKNVQYQLDNNGNATRITYPDGYYVTRVFDNLNRLTDIKLNGAGTSAIVFGYDELSRRTSITWDNGVKTNYTFSLNNALTTLMHIFVNSTMTYSLGYNGGRQLKVQGSTDTSLWHPSAGGTTTYGAANDVNQYPTVGAASLSYNTNGCLTGDGTWTYGFDTENHLTSASKSGVSASFLYDPLHRQAQKTVGSTKTNYFYQGMQRLADYDGTSGTLQNRYVYGVGLDEPLIVVPNSGASTYLHADQIGSIVATSGTTSPNIGKVTNTNKFSPWGDSTAVSGSTFGFTAQRYDSDLDLYYCKMRYLSPKLGRFLQPDPIGYSGGANLYGYTGNDPLNATDPMGLASDGGGDGSGSGSGGTAGSGGGHSPGGPGGFVDYTHVFMGDPNFLAHTHLEGSTPGDDSNHAPAAPKGPPLVYDLYYAYWDAVGGVSGQNHISLLVKIQGTDINVFTVTGINVPGSKVPQLDNTLRIGTSMSDLQVGYSLEFIDTISQKQLNALSASTTTLINQFNAGAVPYLGQGTGEILTGKFKGLLGTNSNALASTLLTMAEIAVRGPSVSAPGWGNDVRRVVAENALRRSKPH